jgi:hypothetical protein
MGRLKPRTFPLFKYKLEGENMEIKVVILPTIKPKSAHAFLVCPSCGWHWWNSADIVICPNCRAKYRHLKDKCGQCKDFKICSLDDEDAFLAVKNSDIACDRFTHK